MIATFHVVHQGYTDPSEYEHRSMEQKLENARGNSSLCSYIFYLWYAEFLVLDHPLKEKNNLKTRAIRIGGLSAVLLSSTVQSAVYVQEMPILP
ncbi:hypothetical protein D3C74_297300 [compost metagenome]